MTQNESLNPIKTSQQWIEQSTNSDKDEEAIPKVYKKKTFLYKALIAKVHKASTFWKYNFLYSA